MTTGNGSCTRLSTFQSIEMPIAENVVSLDNDSCRDGSFARPINAGTSGPFANAKVDDPTDTIIFSSSLTGAYEGKYPFALTLFIILYSTGRIAVVGILPTINAPKKLREQRRTTPFVQCLLHRRNNRSRLKTPITGKG